MTGAAEDAARGGFPAHEKIDLHRLATVRAGQGHAADEGGAVAVRPRASRVVGARRSRHHPHRQHLTCHMRGPAGRGACGLGRSEPRERRTHAVAVMGLRRRVPVVLALGIALARGASAAPAPAGGLAWEGPAGWRLRLELGERVRGEFIDWFQPPAGSPTPRARSDFFASRTRLGLRAERENVEAFVQLQETILANVPDDAPGPGGTYFANTHQSFQEEPILKQAWFKVREPGLRGLSLLGGRILYSDGLEVTPAHPSLAWLARQRIAERLIGPFEYTHVGRSFDGGQVAYDAGPIVLTGFASHPTAGGFEISANRDISTIDVAALTASVPERALAGGTSMGRLFWIYYRDGRDGAVKMDNRSARQRAADRTDIRLHTIGAHALFVRPAGPGSVDGLVWTAGQVGDWGTLDHGAWAYALEAGYQLPRLPASPWLRAGVFRSSGDGDPRDGTHETFFQILPTARTYAQTPFYNLMNSQDVFVQLLSRPWKEVSIRTDAHWLRVMEGKDLLYSGGGATNDDVFGYAGLPAKGRHEVAFLVDVGVAYGATDWLTLAAYYGHAFGQGVMTHSFAGSDLNYGYLEAVLSFF